jgi:hypothetical protein
VIVSRMSRVVSLGFHMGVCLCFLCVFLCVLSCFGLSIKVGVKKIDPDKALLPKGSPRRT